MISFTRLNSLILTNRVNNVILCRGWWGWQLFVVIITINLSRGIDIPSNSPTPETDSIICYQDKLTTTDNIIIIPTTTLSAQVVDSLVLIIPLKLFDAAPQYPEPRDIVKSIIFGGHEAVGSSWRSKFMDKQLDW